MSYYILKHASVHSPLRKKRLQTLSERKVTKRQMTQLEKDRRVVQKCLHKKLKWSKQTGQPIDKIAEQYVPIPLALADSSGIPRALAITPTLQVQTAYMYLYLYVQAQTENCLPPDRLQTILQHSALSIILEQRSRLYTCTPWLAS